MLITITNINGITFTVTVEENDSIESLKKKITYVENINLLQQKLMYNGMDLKNNKTVKDYNLNEESTIHLVVNLIINLNVVDGNKWLKYKS